MTEAFDLRGNRDSSRNGKWATNSRIKDLRWINGPLCGSGHSSNMDLARAVETMGEPSVLATAGVTVGILFGYAAQRSRFCLRSATIEFWRGTIGQKVGVWLIVFSTALITTQTLILNGLLDVTDARQLATRGTLSGAVIGGLLFGTGMMMTRGCVSRLLVLSANGNLRALLSGLVMAVVAQSSLNGILAPARETIAELWTIDGGQPRDLLAWLGLKHSGGLAVGIVWLTAGIFYAFRSSLGMRTALAAALTGGSIALGWLATYAVSQVSFNVVKIGSISFTGPSADVLMLVLDRSHSSFGFDIALIPGVFFGSFLAGFVSRELKLEGFKDGQSMARYIIGAALMGFGGMLAGGCAVGAGVTGGAIFAVTAWIALLSMWLAAGVTDAVMDRRASAAIGIGATIDYIASMKANGDKMSANGTKRTF